ncbi:hypothetical protein [Brucella haematophila]|nr:hypothetical protein [Brucella haematophila]
MTAHASTFPACDAAMEIPGAMGLKFACGMVLESSEEMPLST